MSASCSLVKNRAHFALARRLYAFGPEAVTLALLAATERIAELQSQGDGFKPSPSTPSGMVPIYAKHNKTK